MHKSILFLLLKILKNMNWYKFTKTVLWTSSQENIVHFERCFAITTDIFPIRLELFYSFLLNLENSLRNLCGFKKLNKNYFSKSFKLFGDQQSIRNLDRFYQFKEKKTKNWSLRNPITLNSPYYCSLTSKFPFQYNFLKASTKWTSLTA